MVVSPLVPSFEKPFDGLRAGLGQVCRTMNGWLFDRFRTNGEIRVRVDD